MKLFPTALLLFTTTLFFGQNNKTEEAAMFLDSAFISTNTLNYINPDEIESVNVIKTDTIINHNHYSGQIYIRSKNPKKFNFLSLEQIKSEYTKVRKSDVIYMVNGEFIKEHVDTFKLDRNYILTVEVTNSNEFYNFRKSDTKFDIINILVKTKEKLDAKNKILLRGHEETGIK